MSISVGVHDPSARFAGTSPVAGSATGEDLLESREAATRTMTGLRRDPMR